MIKTKTKTKLQNINKAKDESNILTVRIKEIQTLAVFKSNSVLSIMRKVIARTEVISKSLLFSNFKTHFFVNTISVSLAALFIIWGNDSWAASCPNVRQTVVKTNVHQKPVSDPAECYITIDNVDDYAQEKYRTYLLSDRGTLFVFMSLSSVGGNVEFASKEFYFFPRSIKKQSVSVERNKKQVSLNSVGYQDFIFNTTTSQLTQVRGAELKIENDFDESNDGGLTMMPQKGLIYELPYTYGNAPSANPDTFGIFKDPFNHTCKVQVKDLFKFTSSGDPFVKFTDRELKKFLSQKCPELKYE